MNQPLPRYVDYMYSYPHKTAYRPFPSPVSLLPYLEQVEGQKASLYFHIPFCSHKCGYCNLFSLQTNRADYIATYLETLHKQAQQLSPLTTGLIFDSFAIGGGTPLLLTVSQLEYLLETAALFGRGGSVHRAVLPAQKQRKPEKRRAVNEGFEAIFCLASVTELYTGGFLEELFT